MGIAGGRCQWEVDGVGGVGSVGGVDTEVRETQLVLDTMDAGRRRDHDRDRDKNPMVKEST